MRIDKLTTKFQEALSDAQSLAVGKDNQYIEPAHLLLAMLKQQDSGVRSLLTRAGVNVASLEKGAEKMIAALPEVQGSGEVQVGRDLLTLSASARDPHSRRTIPQPMYAISIGSENI